MLGSGGEAGRGGSGIAAQEHVGHWSVRVALSISLFVLLILLTSIVGVTVHFVCCSVKLPLSRSTSSCLFLSILLPTPAAGGRTSDCMALYCWPWARTITEGHQICQAQFALSEAMFAVTSHLLIFHVDP